MVGGNGSESDALSPEQSDRVERTLSDLLDLPAARRIAEAERRCADDPLVLAEVLLRLEDSPARTQTSLLGHPQPFVGGPSAEPGGDDGKADGSESTSPPIELPGYALLRRIGKGGFGEVWLAKRTTGAGSHCVVKIVSKARAAELKGLSALEQAVRDHPNLVSIHQIQEVDAHLCVVMPLADAAQDGYASILDPKTYKPYSLDTLLERRGRLDAVAAREIALAIASAIHHLHEKGAAHLDVKPANVLRFDGVWKLGDYSLVATIGEPGVGGFTAGYCPPEFLGDRRADLYALGAVLFQLLTGRHVSDVDRFAQRSIRLPQDLGHCDEFDSVIRRLISTSDEQYANAGDAKRDLERIARTMQEVGASTGNPASPSRWRSRALLVPLLGIFAAIVAVAGWRMSGTRGANHGGPEQALQSARQAGEGDAAGSTAPLRVDPLRVRVFRDADADGTAEDIGVLGIGVADVRLGDALAISTSLSEPAHCLLIALNPPDGEPQRLYPGSDDVPPSRSDFIDAPLDGDAYASFLTDEAGTQTFLLIASLEPLPSYTEWLTGERVESLLAQWDADFRPLHVAWRSDGERLEPVGGVRGEIVPRTGGAESLRAVTRTLREILALDAVEGVVFPVLDDRTSGARERDISGG